MARKPNDTPTLKEIFKMMDAVAVNCHPNPDRVGCPEQKILEAFAQNPRSFPMRDPIFEHVAQCAPCFEFVRERRTG